MSILLQGIHFDLQKRHESSWLIYVRTCWPLSFLFSMLLARSYALLNTLSTFSRMIEAWFKNSAPVDTLISLRLSPYPKKVTP